MATRGNSRKLNKLLSDWLPGAVYSSSWLKKHGYGADLLNGYKKNGWITFLGRGAYARFNDKPTLEGGLYALQKQLDLPVHVGGVTALEFQGYAHFIKFRQTQCHLYSPEPVNLPKWFLTGSWQTEITLHHSTLFGPATTGLKEQSQDQIPFITAAPERAILEMLSHVNSEASFTYAWLIMEGLVTMRPKMMQSLLEQCNSVKVTRLCLYMAQKNQLPWLKRLDLNKFNLGSGKRSVVKGGKLNREFQITVPRKLEENTWI